MGTEIEFIQEQLPDIVQLAKVDYSTLVLFEGHYYFKVDKHKIRKTCSSVELKHERHKCILFNPKQSTLRAVSGNTNVKVLNSKILASPCDEKDVEAHKKGPKVPDHSDFFDEDC